MPWPRWCLCVILSDVIAIVIVIAIGMIISDDIVDAAALVVVPGILQCAIRCNAVLGAKLLPKFSTDLIPALSHLQCDDFSRHGVVVLL